MAAPPELAAAALLSPPREDNCQDSPSSPGTHPEKNYFSGARCAFLVVLLLAEILYLSVRFDTDTIGANPSWWAWLLRQVPLVVKGVVAAAASLLVFWGSEYRARLETFFLALKRPHPFWLRYTAFHLALLSFFLEWTLWAAAQPARLAAVSGIWIALWMATLGTVFLSWLLALLPWFAWWEALRQSRGVVLAGAALGASAVGFGLLAQSLAPRLTAATFSVVDVLLRLARESPVSSASASIIGIHNFSVYIGPTCSGVEGIGLVSVFLLVYLWTSRSALRFPQALWLFPIGWVLIWSSNAFRIAALVWIGAHRSANLAVNGFHSQAGWIAFNVVALGIVAASQKMRLFALDRSRKPIRREPIRRPQIRSESLRSEPGARCDCNPASPYLVPLLTMLATGMVLRAVTTSPAVWYPVQVLVMLGCLLYYASSLPRPAWRDSLAPVGIGAVVGLLWLALMPATFRAAAGAAIPGAVSIPSAVPYGLSLWWAARLVGYLLVVPIVEELAFRGYLIRRLIRPEFESVSFKTFSWFAWIGSSVVFGLMHSGLWFPGILAGLLFGLALYRRGSLADAVLAHISANVLIVVFAAATGRWALLS